ncbi:MAG: hypothetical protein AAF401_02380 [Pseudomonadota bacterium]
MKLKTVLTVAGFAVVIATTGHAAPYCEDLNQKETLPAKYQKRGPFYSDADAGWIIGDDQLRAQFKLSSETARLWSDIRSEFDALGVELAVLAAPPRPILTPAEVRTSMGAPVYDAETATESFGAYIAGLNEAGIRAPNLLETAIAAERPYYFQRDTHWTPSGAALSAKALADAIGMTVDAPAPSFGASYDEKGSLSMVVNETCGARPAAETVAAPDFAQAGDANALLGNAAGPALALVGTSFSDRYQRDAYRVADAIAHYSGAAVENFSVSGGGVLSAMEAFIRSGRIREFEVVVWEAPYTEPLTNISALRQILGALISQRSAKSADTQVVSLSDEWASITPAIDMTTKGAIELVIEGAETGQLDVEIYDREDKKTRIKLRKSDRVEPALRSSVWTAALGRIDSSNIARIKLRLKGEKNGRTARLSAL